MHRIFLTALLASLPQCSGGATATMRAAEDAARRAKTAYLRPPPPPEADARPKGTGKRHDDDDDDAPFPTLPASSFGPRKMRRT